jgi:hypothetical protein
MTKFKLQPGLRRGRKADRIGTALLLALLLALLASVAHGVRALSIG